MKKKNKALLTVCMLSMFSSAMAMEVLDDQMLSESTGQDGFSIGIAANNITAKQIAIIDKDGLPVSALPTTYKNAGALVFANNDASKNIGVQLLSTQSGGSDTAYSSSGLRLGIDTDAGAGNPFANITIGLGSDLQRIRISPFSVFLANQASATSSIFTGSTLNSDVTELLRVGNNGIDINFMPNNSPSVNLQLGNTPQGQLLSFHGALKSICSNACNLDGSNQIRLVSGNTGAMFDFKLEATDVTNGFALDGFYLGITPTEGLILGNKDTSSEFNLNIHSLTFGEKNATPDINVFNGLKNSSIGNLGINGASVTNMKMTIKGM